MHPDEKAIRELVDSIFKLNEEIYKLQGTKSDQKLGPPASIAEIQAVERALGITLPADYRAFLLMHNGWHEFNGASSLVSTAEVFEGDLHDSIESLKDVQREFGEEAAAGGFVFEASFGTQCGFFDVLDPRPDGGIDAVFWNNEELARYPDFTSYLQDYLKDRETMLTQERRKLRRTRK